DLRGRDRHQQIWPDTAQPGDVRWRVDVLDDAALDPVTGRQPVDGAAPPSARRRQIERLGDRVATEQAAEVGVAVETHALSGQRAPRRLVQWRRDVDAQHLEPIPRQLGEELAEEDGEVERILLGDYVQPERSGAHERLAPTRRHVTDVRPR